MQISTEAYSQSISYQKWEKFNASYRGHSSEALDDKDVLELGKNRHLGFSYESIHAILEEKCCSRIDAAFDSEGAAKTEPVEAPVDDYWSAENTGKRITDFALKFYETYAQASGGDSPATRDSYLEIIKGAIGEGFAQAEKIIGEPTGGKVPDEKASLIGKTRAYIDTLLEEFRTQGLTPEVTEASPSL